MEGMLIYFVVVMTVELRSQRSELLLMMLKRDISLGALEHFRPLLVNLLRWNFFVCFIILERLVTYQCVPVGQRAYTYPPATVPPPPPAYKPIGSYVCSYDL